MPSPPVLGACFLCTKGVDCSQPGETLQTLSIKEGYWRADLDLSYSRECFNEVWSGGKLLVWSRGTVGCNRLTGTYGHSRLVHLIYLSCDVNCTAVNTLGCPFVLPNTMSRRLLS